MEQVENEVEHVENGTDCVENETQNNILWIKLVGKSGDKKK